MSENYGANSTKLGAKQPVTSSCRQRRSLQLARAVAYTSNHNHLDWRARREAAARLSAGVICRPAAPRRPPRPTAGATLSGFSPLILLNLLFFHQSRFYYRFLSRSRPSSNAGCAPYPDRGLTNDST
ncbi:hypothetical protein EVAR_47282_1 [Eumeta japonica]|uniref:Uncharacterized protein n=1 Tax=Eumeta variegata TaxID=151549 RepID=A0A4C1YX13_EUMVA|nr:hypothetical protein EVAR_47282_1 [Eumeta japonica]